MTRLNLSLDVGKGGPIQHHWRYFRATSGSISKSSILRHPEIALSKWTKVYIIYSCIYIYYEQETVSYSRSQLQVGRQNKCGRFRFVVLRGPWIGESLAYPGATTAPGAIFAWGNGCLRDETAVFNVSRQEQKIVETKSLIFLGCSLLTFNFGISQCY